MQRYWNPPYTGNAHWKAAWQFFRKLKVELSYKTQQFQSQVSNPRIENRDLNRYLYAKIHYSIIHNSQKVETMQMCINRRTDKQNVAYMDDGTLVRNKNGWSSVTRYNMDELENIVLSEINQIQRDKYCLIPLEWKIKNSSPEIITLLISYTAI